ncbi:hypothetical protein KAT95_01190 [Candidatus Parcubacteria bacterium]|nr:hypothetical protein [Candidatus Parcubacteria bacterium]
MTFKIKKGGDLKKMPTEVEIEEGDMILSDGATKSMVVKISRDKKYVALVRVLPYEEVGKMKKI